MLLMSEGAAAGMDGKIVPFFLVQTWKRTKTIGVRVSKKDGLSQHGTEGASIGIARALIVGLHAAHQLRHRVQAHLHHKAQVQVQALLQCVQTSTKSVDARQLAAYGAATRRNVWMNAATFVRKRLARVLVAYGAERKRNVWLNAASLPQK